MDGLPAPGEDERQYEPGAFLAGCRSLNVGRFFFGCASTRWLFDIYYDRDEEPDDRARVHLRELADGACRNPPRPDLVPDQPHQLSYRR
jgi:hypothetical protein